ncbi:DNA (cytosine-5-)-methyltransferase [Streptomyces sp. NPDC052015]|uniref:DNA cytosine methyltransferase n=1 Tax=Streptomyces sp. NPDC052015 TaxID=3154755 RepID=UPI0034265481
MSSSGQPLTSIEICAGAGGQAVGLHGAGFRHLALVEIDKYAAATLELNVVEREMWGEREAQECQILSMDVKEFNPTKHLEKFMAREKRAISPGELDLLAGGVPCPPFSVAGKQLGEDDDRDLFPTMLDLVEELRPRAVMIENVTGLVKPFDKFFTYREQIKGRLRSAGYVVCGWRVLEAADFGVPQLRPRAILVAIREDWYRGFSWPEPSGELTTVAAALDVTMKRRFQKADKLDWYEKWRKKATEAGTVAPTLVGGSKKHGGADLGPTRAKKAWAALGVNGMGVANDEDDVNLERDLGNGADLGPMLTVEQAAIIQGFPKDWRFAGRKTAQYRQVGNAFPPPVAQAVGSAIREALERTGELLEAPAGDLELDGATWLSGQGALV